MLECNVDDKKVTHTLKDVLYVPKAPNNLIALNRFDDANRSVTFIPGLPSHFA
ncbi:hypothetical protein BDN72DRAFT_774149 [Pluteus cervinus]|uniref:Uncharacterized protein n=1 Tax=Pluteus cervinus TaxID=181527 RepID=A0ACD3AGK7_9AGAR|nr:hypothetical protein BDN72DRAFT_774149 [Pluteus cervinus]